MTSTVGLRRLALLGAAAATLLGAAFPALAEETEAEQKPRTLVEALKGKPIVNLRYRFENVEQDGFEKEARASTLRTVIGYESHDYKGFSLYAEAENVAVIGNELYNNAGRPGNGITDRPVVADPAGTEVNQAMARYRSDHWQLALGRQEIIVGDARYVGNVGWRQNHQSLDAFRVDNSSLARVDFLYSYVDGVNLIFGSSEDLNAHLLNAGLDLGQVGRVTLYGYLLDYQNRSAFGLSTSTYGVEFAGKRKLGDRTSLLYELEYADQSDYGDNPERIDAAYAFVLIGGGLPQVAIRLGWEVLGGSAEKGQFRTPLATLHKFNGWADKFLATPRDGLEDLYLQLSGKAGALGWTVRYHDFDAESAGTSYGNELDLQLVYSSPWKVVLGLKGAFYDADGFATDTEKWWVWAAYKL